MCCGQMGHRLFDVSEIEERSKWLKGFSVFTAAAAFVLVCVGGLVTSHGAGLAVPDWPNTYGYNLFFFPISKWVGGVFFEHVHRLDASLVGLLTTILAFWLFGHDARGLLHWVSGIFMAAGAVLCVIFPAHSAENLLLSLVGLIGFVAGFFWPDCDPSPKWLRVLGVVAFVAVVFQGILGGARVVMLKDQIGIFHATLAQLFLLLLCSMTLFQTEFWQRIPFQLLFTLTTSLILTQLILGATMRHQHAGLAIPDFPAAYGKVWPDTDAAAIARYNENRQEVFAYQPITAAQVELQMFHRILAGLIFAAVAACAWRTRRILGSKHWLSRLAMVWLGLVFVQIFLGASTIWTGKSADVATMHVACGALCLVTGGLASVLCFRWLASPATQTEGSAKNKVTSLLTSSSMAAKAE
jgi:heme a synthase